MTLCCFNANISRLNQFYSLLLIPSFYAPPIVLFYSCRYCNIDSKFLITYYVFSCLSVYFGNFQFLSPKVPENVPSLSRCHPANREQEAVGRKPRQGSALLVCCTCIPSLCHPCIGSRCTVFPLYSFPLIQTKRQCYLLQFVTLPVALQLSMDLFMAACILMS